MDKYTKTEYGFKIANPDAVGRYPSGTTMATLRHKDYVGVNPSLDTVALTTSGNFTAFVFDGVTVTLATPIAVANVDDIRQALYDEIQKKEGAVWVSVVLSGGVLTIQHIGHLRLASVACSDVSAGAQQATTNKTTLVTVSKFSFTDIVGTVGPLRYSNTNEALANDPYAHVGTPATDDATAADLAADMDTALAALGLTVYTGTVCTRDDSNSAYDGYVEVYGAAQGILLVGADQLLVQSEIREEFV